MPDGRPDTKPRSRSIQDLAQAAGDARIVGDASSKVTGLTYDSRSVQPGDMFAALRGSDFDGHRYIENAISAGASAILAEEAVDGDVPVIVVGNSRAALAPVSAEFYGHPSRDLTMIGLTGTDGKTTTSYLVRDILTSLHRQTGMIGTVGIDIGDGMVHHLPHQTTPESNLVQKYLRDMVDSGTECAILEATSHGLHMHRLDDTHFTIAGVTNITHEHLEYHKTIENYRLAKAILIERVAAEDGVVVLNADDEGARSMARHADSAQIRLYGVKAPDTDYHASNVVVRNSGTEFDLIAGGERHHVRLPLLGKFNVENALCAIAVTHASGLDIPEIIGSLAEAGGIPGRMNRIERGQPFSVVVDYAHTPESLAKIIVLLRDLHPDGRVIVVSGSAGERDAAKRPLQGGAMARLADISIVTSEDPRNEDPDAIIREIADGALAEGAKAGANLFEITDRQQAIRTAFEFARPGDCVLLAGKGHETSIIWGFEHRPWNETAVAGEELRRLGYSMEAAR